MITPEWLHHKHCSRDLGHPSHPKSNSSPARRDQRSHFQAAVKARRHNLTSVSPAIQLLHDWGLQWCHGHSLVQNPNHLGIGRSLSSSGTPGEKGTMRTSGHVKCHVYRVESWKITNKPCLIKFFCVYIYNYILDIDRKNTNEPIIFNHIYIYIDIYIYKQPIPKLHSFRPPRLPHWLIISGLSASTLPGRIFFWDIPSSTVSSFWDVLNSG